MAPTTPIEADSSLLWSYSQTRTVKNELGQDDFLKLLVAQLQHQDPLEPQKDTDFIAQLAQFQSLQSLQSMSQAMTYSQAYALVGKVVVAEAYVDGQLRTIPGVVDGIIVKDNETYAQIGDYMVKTSTITQVYDNELFKIDQTLMNASGLIGRTITALITETKEETVPKTGEDGEDLTETVKKDVQVPYTGVVTGVGVEDGQLLATIQIVNPESGEVTAKKVPVSSIVDIRLTEAPNTGNDNNP